MSSLIVAADLSVLGGAAAELAAVFGGAAPAGERPTLGHSGAESALDGFAGAAGRQRQALADQAAAGATSLRGFMLAFHNAAG